jgi:membrane-bound lytic murein transglycosylase D
MRTSISAVISVTAALLLAAVIAKAAPVQDNQQVICDTASADANAAQPLTKEEREMEEITTDTTTLPSLRSVLDKASALTEDQKDSLRKAEKFYREAVICYRLGDTSKAKKFYNSFTAMLNAANMGADLQYYLTDDYDRLFLKVNRLVEASSSKRYTIPMNADNEVVKKYLKIYTEGEARERINRAMERSGRYREMVLSVLKEYGLPEELFYLPIVESLYSNNDLSSAGALGIWQFMPKRARALNLKTNYWIDERKDPEKATRAAAEYLRDLFLMFDDWHLALAAYNRGEYGLGRDLRFSQATNIVQMADRKAVPRETEKYVPQFIAATIIAENYKDYGFNPKFEQPEQYDEVITTSVVDLKIVSECVNTDVETIRELNPAIMAWCTPQNYPDFKLKLPKGTRDMYLENIAKIKDVNPTRGFIKYKVAKNDSLSKIAYKFKTSIESIREDNKLKRSCVLRIGQVLIVRPGKKYFSGKKV